MDVKVKVRSKLEVLNSFWALKFGGTVLLKVIWVSGPRQMD
jgi:hypothetical protein